MVGPGLAVMCATSDLSTDLKPDRNQEDREAADGMNALARPSGSGPAEIVHGASGKPSVLPDAVMGEVVLSDV